VANAHINNKYLKVLHVEDSPRDAEIIRERLIDGGFSMHLDWAVGEQEFLTFLRSNQYDLILADYQLLGFDAPAALKLAHTLAPNVPFICVSGAIGEDKAVELLKQGATDYVSKNQLDKLPLVMQRAIKEIKERTERQFVEEALRESERFLSESQKAAGIGSYVTELKTRIWKASPQIYKIFGIDETYPHTFDGWAGFIHPDSRAELFAYQQQVETERKRFDHEYKIIRINDGVERWVHGLGELECDNQLNPVRLIGTIQDITERKLMSDQLDAAATQVIGLVSQVMTEDCFTGRFENPNLLRCWEEKVCTATDCPAYGNVGNLRCWEVTGTFCEGNGAQRTFAQKFGDCTSCYVYQGARTNPILELGETFNAMAAILDDRREALILAKDALQTERDNLAAIFASSPVGMLLLDEDTMIVDANVVVENMVSRGPGQVIGLRCGDGLGCVHSFEEERGCGFSLACSKCLLRKIILQVLQTGTSVNGVEMQHTLLINGQEHRPSLSVSATPVLLKGRRHVNVAITDITEHKHAEEERKKLQIQLQQAQKMEAIGTLAGGIAHDFNNILGAILGYAEMVQEDSPVGSMLRKDIDQVVKASHRAKDLVKQILAFSRQTETDQIPLQPEIIIKEALKMLRSSLPTTIDIQQDIDPEAGLILADPTQIHQVMVNFCTNAFHAMEETGGTLTISLKKKTLSKADLANEPHVQPGDFVQLSISDTGPGIAPEIQAKMFDPYFTTKEVGKGTGMGLAIIHGIAKSYNGFVTCHSQLGEGTVFQVYLPVIADPTLHEIETAPSDLTQLGNEHILFIDDEEILVEMGQAMLERLGYRVTVRKSSIDALNTFQNQPDQFDLVITDQTMPGMTGSDLARRMLQIRPGMPIILCTGYSTLISEEKARGLGIKGFAMKPLAKKDIAALIRKVLDGGALQS
jgi:PAS domain S-box-containing protein